VYSLEEVVAEKLRAILQHVEMFKRRGWSRSRARDYYDLWRVPEAYTERKDLGGLDSPRRAERAGRGGAFAGADQFFADRALADVETTWEQWLGPLVPELTTFETVISGLRPQVKALVNPSWGNG